MRMTSCISARTNMPAPLRGNPLLQRGWPVATCVMYMASVLSCFRSRVRVVAARSARSICSSRPLFTTHRVCIIGSGPAGFYTAHKLLKLCPATEVDILERLPVPYGLVRFGVAPDHPEVKNVINQFHALASDGKCNFIGNIDVGSTVTVQFLKERYHAVVLAYGAAKDRKLDISGENLPGVCSAGEFVGWYNGVPELKDMNPDLTSDTAVIIGQGNVAVDVARMLLSGEQLLKSTDICEHALAALRSSNIKKVHLVGRRGPLQAAFTIKEFRELTRLPQCTLSVGLSDFPSIEEDMQSLPRPRKRLTELIVKTAWTPTAEAPQSDKQCYLQFLRSPVAIVADERGERVAGVKLELNELKASPDGPKAYGTGHFEIIKCGVVFRSIGYKSVKVDKDIPFDHNKGVVLNEKGRIVSESGGPVPGLYCSGWVKRGAEGVIVSTMQDAFETAECIADDLRSGALGMSQPVSYQEMLSHLQEKGARPVTFSDWEKINQKEVDQGTSKGKPREKVVQTQEMFDIIDRK